jgi:hypothetical protein
LGCGQSYWLSLQSRSAWRIQPAQKVQWMATDL